MLKKDCSVPSVMDSWTMICDRKILLQDVKLVALAVMCAMCFYS